MKQKIAKILTNAAISIARKAAGQMSVCGTYQPKEPANIASLIQKN